MWLNRVEVEHRLVGVFALGAVPAAAVGAWLFATAPLPALTRAIGVFLLVIVVWRRRRPHSARLDYAAFAAVGAASGFGSALVGSVGPMVAPFFLARGLVRGAPPAPGQGLGHDPRPDHHRHQQCGADELGQQPALHPPASAAASAGTGSPNALNARANPAA
ncbi:TSUP family transporter [Nonomuraea helvata]|uniref:Probable membrane transporter protein n=1 Tax=Nonomuraea helvata TaxID=37484 RepID=A0ABV5SJN8_9ACTN